MSDVFLSYSRQDIRLMRKVRDSLRAEGLDVWTDENLEPGTPIWQKAIASAIQNARSFVVILSPDANNSEWVTNEISYARACQRRIFPVLARGEAFESIPLNLHSVQRIDIRTNYKGELQKLIEALKKHVVDEIVETPAQQTIIAAPPSPAPQQDCPECHKFWTQFLEKSRTTTGLFSDNSPSRTYWIGVSTGKTGIKIYCYILARSGGRVELYIDYYQSKETNKLIFDALFAQKDVIEREMGEQLVWSRMPEQRISKIELRFPNGGLNYVDTWPDLQAAMIDATTRMNHVFRPRLEQIRF
jgi:hypothetical protein